MNEPTFSFALLVHALLICMCVIVCCIGQTVYLVKAFTSNTSWHCHQIISQFKAQDTHWVGSPDHQVISICVRSGQRSKILSSDPIPSLVWYAHSTFTTLFRQTQRDSIQQNWSMLIYTVEKAWPVEYQSSTVTGQVLSAALLSESSAVELFVPWAHL